MGLGDGEPLLWYGGRYHSLPDWLDWRGWRRAARSEDAGPVRVKSASFSDAFVARSGGHGCNTCRVGAQGTPLSRPGRQPRIPGSATTADVKQRHRNSRGA